MTTGIRPKQFLYEDVVNFYNKGGHANEFLEMRDLEAERAYEMSRRSVAAWRPGRRTFSCRSMLSSRA